MAEWIVCPSCNLHHSVRPTRTCPRCKMSIDGAPTPPDAPANEGPAFAPPPMEPTAAPLAAEPIMAGEPAEAIAHDVGGQRSPGPGVRGAEAPRITAAAEFASGAAHGCVNHPAVTTGLVSCRRCGRRFCPDCVVALRGAFFCVDCKGEQVRDVQSGAIDRRLGVMECLSMGWELVTQDFWPVWTVGLVFFAISLGVGVLGLLPFGLGTIIQLGAAFFVNPPLQAGLAYAALRKIDGDPAEVGNLFEAFRTRYWPSVLVMLPVMGLYFATVIAFGLGAVGFMLMYRSLSASAQETAMMVGIVALVPLFVLAALVAMFLTAAVWFAFIEMWDGPASGWTALVAGLRVAKANLGSVLGLSVMLGLAGLAAALLGVLALCVGLLFTVPFITVWVTVAHAYAYRSWSRAGVSRAY